MIFSFLLGLLLRLWGKAEAVTPVDFILRNIGELVIVIFVYFAVFQISPFLIRKFTGKKMPPQEKEL